jgi:hypothetical protein
MTWTRKSPFTNNEDPVEHMVELLSNEGENVGTPFNADEKQVLRRKASNVEPVPDSELRIASTSGAISAYARKSTVASNRTPLVNIIQSISTYLGFFLRPEGRWSGLSG